MFGNDPSSEAENIEGTERQALALPSETVEAVRLEIAQLQLGQWVVQESITRPLGGGNQLQIVFIDRARRARTFAPRAAPRARPDRVLGMDVSYAQAFTVDFEKAANAGVRFCFIRAASGKNEKDENFDHNFAQAGRVGMLRGIYYYLYPEKDATVGDAAARSPEGQARRFASLLKSEAELGAVLDVEAKDLTPGEVQRFVRTFQEHDPYGRPVMIYTAAWFWNGSRGFSGTAVDWAAQHPLWVAHYTHMSEPIPPAPAFRVAIPAPWQQCAVHQWTSSGGSLVGHDRVGLDLNYFQGSLSDLRAWANVSDTMTEESASEVPEPKVKYVTAEDGLNVRSEPVIADNVIIALPWGTPVTVLREGQWDFIQAQNFQGYASSQFLSIEAPSADATVVVAPDPTGTGAAGGAAGDFKFRVWPTNTKRVTQYFGERPEFYKNISNGFLPGHEGIDLAAPFGTPYFCVAPGKVVAVTDKRRDGTASAYGWHVVVDHGNGYSTLYAHATSDILVSVGDTVAAGQILAHSGNTGVSSAPHLHITLQKKGHETPGWPAGYMDPWPFLEPLFNNLRPPTGNLAQGYLWARSLEMRANRMAVATLNLNMRQKPDGDSRLLAVVPQGSTVRLLSTEKENGYLLSEVSVDLDEQPNKVIDAPQEDQIDLLQYVKGDGRQYEVRNGFGSQERFQTREDGLTFYLVKNAQWEQFVYDNDFIYRDVDTSPGGGRYYRLTDPDRQAGSRWLRRRMAIGETYTQSRRVQFYNKDDGSPSEANSGTVVDTIKVVAHHARRTFQTDVEIDDVLELHWVNGRDDHRPKEKYFYARGLGMVGWARAHADPNSPAWSAVAEIHKRGTREEIPRERIVIR